MENLLFVQSAGLLLTAPPTGMDGNRQRCRFTQIFNFRNNFLLIIYCFPKRLSTLACTLCLETGEVSPVSLTGCSDSGIISVSSILSAAVYDNWGTDIQARTCAGTIVKRWVLFGFNRHGFYTSFVYFLAAPGKCSLLYSGFFMPGSLVNYVYFRPGFLDHVTSAVPGPGSADHFIHLPGNQPGKRGRREVNSSPSGI